MDRRCPVRMVVVFTTNYAISAYHWSLTLWVQIPLRWGVLDTTLCDKFVRDLHQVGGFLRVLEFLHQQRQCKAWRIPSPKTLILWPWPLILKIIRVPDSLKDYVCTKFGQNPLKDVDSRVFTRIKCSKNLTPWPWKSIGFQTLLRTKYVPSLVKIHWKMLILKCSQGCYTVKN